MITHTEIAVEEVLRPLLRLAAFVKTGEVSVEAARRIHEASKPTEKWSEVMAADHQTVLQAWEDAGATFMGRFDVGGRTTAMTHTEASPMSAVPTTVAAPSGLDEAVAGFPAAISLRALLEPGVPVVWAYNRYLTGTLVSSEKLGKRRSRGREVLTVWHVTENRVTSSGNVEAATLTDGPADDRWRIDLSTPRGFAFGLRLAMQSSPYLTDDSTLIDLDEMSFRNLRDTTTELDIDTLIQRLNEMVWGRVGLN